MNYTSYSHADKQVFRALGNGAENVYSAAVLSLIIRYINKLED